MQVEILLLDGGFLVYSLALLDMSRKYIVQSQLFHSTIAYQIPES